MTENWQAADGPARLAQLLNGGWRSAAVWTQDGHWQLDQSRKGAWRLVRHQAKAQVAAADPGSLFAAIDLAQKLG